jgi:glycosyltransferase involved in cell wall biosynthesis
MNSKLIVSVVVPTYNSQKTLDRCLKSVWNQSFQNIALIVVDSYSRDETVKIAQDNNAKLIQTSWKLLGARYLGLLECKGDFVLMLDSDQILEKTTIERAVQQVERNLDMLCLEENAFKVDTWMKRLFESDRQLINKLSVMHLDPLQGVLLARFYRKKILYDAFNNIPKELLPTVIAHDHALIYYEARKLSDKVGIVTSAVQHEEPAGICELWVKNFRYGKSTYDIAKNRTYQRLLKEKVCFRRGSLKVLKLGLQSCLLLLIKGVPYYLGYLSMKIKNVASIMETKGDQSRCS